MARVKDSTENFERALAHPKRERLILKLYVAGTTPASARALANIKDICEEHFEGRYDLEVIDIYQQPVLAAHEQIVAVPTLIKRLPAPLRRLIGDLSNRERVLIGLDLKVGQRKHAKEIRQKTPQR